MTQDPISSETHTPVLSANASIGVMVTPIRQGRADSELGHEGCADTLRAGDGDGGSSRNQLIAVNRHAETIVRRLTELECERLQGYPDGWTEGQTASARYRQLGNSVAVPCVEWIARRLIAVDEAAQ
jgi:DNA (cytosine-5)-methyltransferase 1